MFFSLILKNVISLTLISSQLFLFAQSQPIKKTSVSIDSPSSSYVANPAENLLPTRIVISKIGVDVKVANPTSTNLNTLNDYLTRSTIRYPGSGNVEEGNILIMGHSSELKVVKNQIYRVFSKVKTLVPGDEISVYAGSKEYKYRVKSMRMQSAKDPDAYISFEGRGLTLVTCNVLGQKEDRYIVNADLI